MPLDTQNTTLSGAPYFDDFSNAEANNYHRVLFKPSVAVQARELTQLQTILQNQIERFGDNIYRRGTILSGCNMVFDSTYDYVKVEDVLVDGRSVATAEYANTLVQDSKGLQAYVVNHVPGLVSQAPNLNTLYVKYINVGTEADSNGNIRDVKTFSANSVLTSYNRARRIERVDVLQGGVGYSNTDVVVFTANNDSGTGAQAAIVTDAAGAIRSVTLTSKGTGYLNPPAVSVLTSTGISSSLQAINYIGQLTIANSNMSSVGQGYAVRVADGYIYQKGHFLKVEEQTLIISKYETVAQGQPAEAVIGFKTGESIATSVTDSTLLDNATGTPNEMAPGADRLKLVPTLAVYTLADASEDSNFLSLVEFESGMPVRSNLDTVFNSIDKAQARRTFEESGDYVVSQYGIYGEERRDFVEGTTNTYVSNTTHLNMVVTPGTAYVNGIRVQTINNRRVAVRKGTDTSVINNQGVSTNFGSFVYVNELLGDFNPLSSQTVTLYGAATGSKALTAMTAGTDTLGGIPSMPASSIGTAKIRGLEYDSGVPGTPTCTYRMYIYDIKMSTGKSFADTFVIGISTVAIADVVRTSGRAVLQDVTKDGVIFPLGTNATKSISDASLQYRAISNTVSISTAGTGDVTISTVGATFPYTPGTTVSLTEENEFIIIPTTSVRSANVGGAFSITAAGNTITGTTTSFTSTFNVGDTIAVLSGANVYYNRITSITNDLLMGVASAWPTGSTNTSPGANGAILFPAYQPIALSQRAGAQVAITSTTTATISLGTTINAAATGTTVVHNAKIDNPTVKSKKIRKDIFVKLSTTSTTASPVGPWCLGIPDVHRITGVYLGTSTTYADPDTATNYIDQFELVNGQTDNIYGLSYLRRGPNASVAVDGTTNLLVKLDAYYDHGSVVDGAFYAGAVSYPVDDINREANTAGITTEEIELFVSPKTGTTYNLRDCLDFRPVVANTANVEATSTTGATIDPATTETISVLPGYFASPSKYAQADIEYYLPRYDVLSIVPTLDNISVGGTFVLTEGVASITPSVPRIPESSMALATIVVPPYPSLDPLNAKQANRPDLAVRTTIRDQQKRYTMKDIGGIEKRIDRLEYYSLLNRMESSAKDLAAGRTLNGFTTDSFDNFEMSSIDDTEFNAFIDTQAGELRPRVYSETIELKVDNNSGSQTSGVDLSNQDQVTLPYTTVEMMAQPFASRVRNLTGELWRFKGSMFIYPKYDGQYDRDVAPASITIDISSAQQSIVDAINTVFSQMDGRTTVTGTTTQALSDIVSNSSSVNGATTTTVTTTTSRARTTTSGIIEKGNINVGAASDTLQGTINTITDVEFNPFMRSQPITFFVTGLRPGAKHYVFFDGQDVSAHVIPGEYVPGSTTISSSSVRPTGTFGGELRADSQGRAAGIFYIPAETFYVGERELLIMDVSSTSSESGAISTARAKYNAYNITTDHQQVSISTKQLESVTGSMVQTYAGVLSSTVNVTGTTTAVSSTTAWQGGDGGGGDGGGGGSDPIAQTFTIPDEINSATDGVFVTGIDLFFQSISATSGVTVQIRDVVNGYPGQQIIPFGTKWLPSTSIATSSTAVNATRFLFDTPVFLNSGREYCFVIMPDGNNPDFFVWTGEAGQADITNPNIVSKSDWGRGQMFTSVNNTAWNPHSFEDVKFTLLRANFTQNGSGSVSLAPDNYEFLTIDNVSGGFIRGERVAQKSSRYNVGQVQTTNTTFTITGVNTLYGEDVNVNDTVLIVYGVNPSNTAITGLITTTTSSATIAGAGTAFNTDLAVGDYVQINGNIRQIINIASDTVATLDAPTSNIATSNSVYKFESVGFDVMGVRQIINDTTIISDRTPKYTTNSTVSAVYMKTVSGEVDRYRVSDKKLYLRKSTASNSSFRFVQSKYSALNNDSGRALVSGLSNSSANVASIDNLTVNYIDSELRTISPTGTGARLSYSTTKVGSTALTTYPGEMNGTTAVPFSGEIRSRTNEISGTSTNPSMRINIPMITTSKYVSPAVDIEPAQVQIIRNVIDNYTTITQQSNVVSGSANVVVSGASALVVGMGVRGKSIPTDAYIVSINTATNTAVLSKAATGNQTNASLSFHPNENTRYGISKNKYVSKYMVLADGMEAEDFKVYLTSYRPVGTEIDVYARFISGDDGEEMNRKEWTQLTLSDNPNIYSDPLRPTDYKEYTYVVPKAPPSTTLAGRGTTAGTTTLTGLSTTFQTDLVVGDVIKLVGGDGTTGAGVPVYGDTQNYHIVTVTAIASQTSLTIDQAIGSNVGWIIQKVTQPRAAFLYNKTTPQYILTYHGASGDGTVTAQYRGFKYVALKIVLRSTSSQVVPVVRDTRALSLMV